MQAFDDCGAAGDYCPANEVVVNVPVPCTPEAPEAPSNLTALVGESSVYLTWEANTVDCDLEGYSIWYGYAPDYYNGVGAAEGNSPIEVSAETVTSGGSCGFSITGLDLCATYYIVVTSNDRCTPHNQSPYSNQVVAGTSCVACDLTMSCSPMVASGTSYETVTYGVYPESVAETVSRMTASWSQTSGQKLAQVWANGTLVWHENGSAGLDGALGPVGPGTVLHCTPFLIDTTFNDRYGFPMRLVFTNDMRNNSVYTQFQSSGLPCEVSAVAKPALLVDDFNDGNYNGWTISGGTWSVTPTGVLQQTSTSGTKWLHTSTISTGEDFIFEAWTSIASGTYTILQFNRYSSTGRWVGLLNNSADTINLASMNSAYSDIVWTSVPVQTNRWYKLRVEKVGSVYQFYRDCTHYLTASIFPIPPAGRFGFGTTSAWCYFDDVTITSN
jgi:hypothetical protein